jgi:PAS domain S-box-containing protein
MLSPGFKKLWQGLSEPHPRLTSPEDRRYARLLMFLMAGLGPGLWFISAALGPPYPHGISLLPLSGTMLRVNLAIIASYLLGYGLSRWGAYRLATYWALIFFSLLVIGLSFNQAEVDGDYSALHYLVLLILFSNIYLSLWGTGFVLFCQMAVILVLRQWQGAINDSDLLNNILFVFGGASFISLTLSYYKRIEQKRVNFWRESEEGYRQLMHHNMSGVTIHDGQTILFANPMAAQILGYEDNQAVLGLALSKIIHPEDAPLVSQRIQARLRGDPVPNQYMLRIFNRQGQIRWIETDAQRIVFQGQACIMANSIDLTERIQAEADLRHRNAVLERLHRLALATSSSVDFQALVKEIVHQFGQTIPGSHIYLRRYLPDSQQSLAEAYYQAASPPPLGATLSQEDSLPDFLNHLSPQLMQEQSYFYWLLQATDLGPEHPYYERLTQQGIQTILFLPLLLKAKRTGTLEIIHTGAPYEYSHQELDLLAAMANQTALAYDRVKIYTALEKSERHNRLILNSLAGLILSQNRQGTYTQIIYDAQPVLPFGAAALLNHQPGQFFPETIAQVIQYHLQQALQTDQVQVFEYTLTWGDQEVFYETWMVKSNDQEVLSLIRDISPSKQALQQQLDLSIERERVKILENFIRDASHDLRTPIANVKSRLYLLNKADTPEKRQRQLDVMEGEISRLEKLIDDLLTMSHLDASVQDKTLREIYLNRLVNDVLEIYRSLAEKKDIRIDFHAQPKLPIMMGDEVALGRVLGNLLSNAINYTPPGGHISLQTRIQAGGVELEVRDDGIGIAEDDMPHIFERFYRADKARNTDLGGTGLGLAIVKKIVELHEGRIQVQSQVNHGASFCIWFPSPLLKPEVSLALPGPPAPPKSQAPSEVHP